MANKTHAVELATGVSEDCVKHGSVRWGNSALWQNLKFSWQIHSPIYPYLSLHVHDDFLSDLEAWAHDVDTERQAQAFIFAIGLNRTVRTEWVHVWKSSFCGLPNVAGLVFLGDGRLGEDSGCGATGCTGRVCLAASFFKLTCLLSNISCTSSSFCKTFWALAWKQNRCGLEIIHRWTEVWVWDPCSQTSD